MRSRRNFRNWITSDGSPDPSGDGGFKAESGRYHLYVSYACPWAHRTLIFRALKGLEDHIDISVVHPDMLDEGWTFATDFPGTTGDTLFGHDYLRDEIEAVNARVYDIINNGVYRAVFATTQDAYDEAVTEVFAALDWAEERLAANRDLLGENVTEADWRLLPTLLRFDPVCHGHFKCNRRRLVDYPTLWAYARELYHWPGVARTVHPAHYVRHCHYSHDTINPHRIAPIGPDIDWTEPHGRG